MLKKTPYQDTKLRQNKANKTPICSLAAQGRETLAAPLFFGSVRDPSRGPGGATAATVGRRVSRHFETP